MSWLISGRHVKKPSPPRHLGILSFETAKSMSRLVSLYHSLSDAETLRLRSDLSSSPGLSRLTSSDHHRLLSLAAAERLSDLNSSAAAAARLSLRCSDPALVRFDLVYSDLKLGLVDTARSSKKLDFGSKNVLRAVEKMDRLAGATARLYSAMESLHRLEISERKIDTWRRASAAGSPAAAAKHHRQFERTDFGLFDDKVDFVRREVERLRDSSLWKTTYDKSVGLMARVVCVVYVRICVVFGPFIAKNNNNNNNSNFMKNDISEINGKTKSFSCLLEDRKFHQRHKKRVSKSGPLGNNNNNNNDDDIINNDNNYKNNNNVVVEMEATMSGSGSEVWRLAGPTTVGGAGMTGRYAGLIVAAERCAAAPEAVTEEARAGLYGMLTWRLRRRVAERVRAAGDDVAEETMTWLGPVAHDTVMWQAERNVERQKFGGGDSGAGERVLLVQTLHFADLEKTEAAIADVLVGLSRVLASQNPTVGDGFGKIRYKV